VNARKDVTGGQINTGLRTSKAGFFSGAGRGSREVPLCEGALAATEPGAER
jgi:hypothetical protein